MISYGQVLHRVTKSIIGYYYMMIVLHMTVLHMTVFYDDIITTR